jgi:hypothetical protein
MTIKQPLDKYYTYPKTAKIIIDLTLSIIKPTEIIEPSAGNGSFSNQIDCIAYDIEPDIEGIIKQDFLTLPMEYKEGRLFIGNPPFGKSANLARQFIAKCMKYGDYISFILPKGFMGSDYNNFEIIHSEVIGIDFISKDNKDIKLDNRNMTSLIIWKRNNNYKKVNKREILLKNNIIIKRFDRKSDGSYKKNIEFKPDLCLVRFGGGCCKETIPSRQCGWYEIKAPDNIIREFRSQRFYDYCLDKGGKRNLLMSTIFNYLKDFNLINI